MRAQENFRGSVPPSGYFLSEYDVVHEAICDEGPCQAEVADFHGAVAVEEEVGGFEIAVDDFCGVEELDAAGELVEDKSVMSIFQYFLATLYDMYPIALCRSASMN